MRCRPAGRVPPLPAPRGEGGPKGRMRCSRRSGVSPCVIILLFSFEQLALFSARSARAKGSGDPAPVPLILWTPYPLPAPGLRARTRGMHKSIHISYVNKQVGAPSDAPFLCAGIVWYLCRVEACLDRCTQPPRATPPKHKLTLLHCRGGACPARCTNLTSATPPKYKSTLQPL